MRCGEVGTSVKIIALKKHFELFFMREVIFDEISESR